MRARKAFDEALTLDPASTEANLYRIYMLLSRGEKESARHGIASLLGSAANDWNVHLLAGIALRCDGMYEEALDEFSRALKLNPANAAILYNHRARVYHYQNQIELAGDELEKGLALEPRHPLLRTSAGYQQMRLGNLNAAIEILERVIADDPLLRIAVPTLAICYVQAGDRARGAMLLKDETLAAAEADSEMAYRLATYFAVDGDSSEALHWLRRAIYLGNENYPWFQKNPAWNNLRTNADFERILEDLKTRFPQEPENLEATARAGAGGRLRIPLAGSRRYARRVGKLAPKHKREFSPQTRPYHPDRQLLRPLLAGRPPRQRSGLPCAIRRSAEAMARSCRCVQVKARPALWSRP